MPKILERSSQNGSVNAQIDLTVRRVLQKEFKPHGFDHDGFVVTEVIESRSAMVTSHS